ncbi:hypothetical protein QTO34_000668 [Cnephaeus nilssonii]|uniref:Protein YIPF n=1 Tax=Cnephaeus nilssonii TaxID=3371016 RepID=A0AA40IC06_CNENI|nr:hypothetical protein QTO34_000668 [Eptesicus nilssonii]
MAWSPRPHQPLRSVRFVRGAAPSRTAQMLQRGSADNENDGGPQFAEVFVIIWFGAVTITLNSKLLGGNISFFQSLCVLGYCILPLTVALLVCRLVLLAKPGPINFIVRLFVVIVMFAWSIESKCNRSQNVLIFTIAEQKKVCVRDKDQMKSSITPNSHVSNMILAYVVHRTLCSKWAFLNMISILSELGIWTSKIVTCKLPSLRYAHDWAAGGCGAGLGVAYPAIERHGSAATDGGYPAVERRRGRDSRPLCLSTARSAAAEGACRGHPAAPLNGRVARVAPLSGRRPSKVGELGACLLRHQAFQKPPPSRRLLKGLVHQRTGTQLHREKRKRVGDPTPSTAFLADSQPPNRKALAIYPVFLFYFVISWMILTFTP